MIRNIVLLTVVLIVSRDGFSQPRDFEIGAHVGWVGLDELDTTDFGFGGRLSYRATPLFAVEGELSYFPSDVPDDVPVTSSRLEGLVGVKFGPRFDRFAVFGKLRPGFVRFGEAPEPVACIAIFPPPLSCVLAEGKSLFALDVGGGVELYPGERSVVRVDVSSLLLRYPSPALNRVGESFLEGGFWGANLRVTVGVGLHF